MAGGLARLDRAGLADRAAVEQELFRQRGLARIGVGNDGERAPTFDFLLYGRHKSLGVGGADREANKGARRWVKRRLSFSFPVPRGFKRHAAPKRIADTRPTGETVDGQVQRTGQRAAGSTLQLQVAGRAGIDADAIRKLQGRLDAARNALELAAEARKEALSFGRFAPAGETPGSNNWVVAPSKSSIAAPIAVSIWITF